MTNTNNPFGDSKLTDTFVWQKKLEKKGLSDVPADKLKVITAQRVEENKVRESFQQCSDFQKRKF